VVLPYYQILADHLPRDLKMRRTVKYVLSLIVITTLVHQWQRAMNRHGQLEATLTDYALAREMLIGTLRESMNLDDADYQQCLATESLLRTMKVGKSGRFTTTDAMQALGVTRRQTAKDALGRLAERGVVRMVKVGKGTAATVYAFTGRTVDEALLPGVAAIAAACRKNGIEV
jgi:hypothetical protein